MTETTIKLYEKAKEVTPGGVNSPARAGKEFLKAPLFLKKAKGAIISSVDNKEMIDYVGGFGPMILGHCHPEVTRAIAKQAAIMTCIGSCHEQEFILAEKIKKHMPSMEKVRLVSTGTEACMSAIRLARGATGKDYIIKFNGCYHGHSDSLLATAGSSFLDHEIQGSPGVPSSLTKTHYMLSIQQSTNAE